MSHRVRGNNNIIGNNNVLIAEGSFAGMQRLARAHVAQLHAAASKLQRWAHVSLCVGLFTPGLAGDWLPAEFVLTTFFAGLLGGLFTSKVAEQHRNEAQRIWNQYGLF